MNRCSLTDGIETTCGKNICCMDCVKNAVCPDACKTQSENCENLIKDSDTNNKDLTETPTTSDFLVATEPILRQIATFETEIKKAENERDILREKLIKAMKEFGVKMFDNEFIKLVYIAPTHKELIDSKRLREERPDIATEYTKVSEVKESVKITVH